MGLILMSGVLLVAGGAAWGMMVRLGLASSPSLILLTAFALRVSSNASTRIDHLDGLAC